MKNKYELLAPVGGFPQLHAAISAGADAIYMGLKDFNMRVTGRNFSFVDLKKASKICKENKVKLYLTLNVIFYDNELKKLDALVKKVKPYVDAIICWDLSVIEACKKHKVEFHISTQASISNSGAARFYTKLGAQRIVLARELNLKQIKEISKINEIEVFCHGAMCVSISGRCFTSQFQQGISANRGQCTQPCRRAYKIIDKTDESRELVLDNNRVMSAKDLCTLPFIQKMKDAGITSFKIEGRIRSPEYVYAVVKEYRKALDNKLTPAEIKESIENLKKVYNRGFSSGFMFKMPTNDDFTYSENGEQTEKKVYVGKIFRYWPKAKAASVSIHAGTLKVGDEVYIMSKKAAVQRLTIESMEFDKKETKVAKKGQDVGIKLPKVYKDDEIYVIRKK